MNYFQFFFIISILNCFMNKSSNVFSIIFFYSPRSHSLHSNSKSRWIKWRIWIIWNYRFRRRNSNLIQNFLNISSRKTFSREIHNYHMIISSSCNQLISIFQHFFSQCLCIHQSLVCIIFKFRSLSLSQSYCNSCDSVHMRPTLHSWEYCPINSRW